MKISPQIDTAGISVSVAITFGHASIGRYRIWLYDTDDKNPNQVLEGASDDNVADEVVLPDSAPKLVGRLVFVRAVAATAVATTSPVSATVTVTQDGKALAGGSATIQTNLEPGEEATCNFAIRFRA